jgi:ribosome-binding protein aMBF1 (putative translation factor)
MSSHATLGRLVIRNPTELQECRKRLRAERQRRADYAAQLEAVGLPREDLAHAIEPVEAFVNQLQDAIHEYERAQRSDVSSVSDLRDLGRCLVALRVASGLTQRELAAKLGVHESLISRDERNEYHGLTIQRAAQILDALSVRLECSFHISREASGTQHGEG